LPSQTTGEIDRKSRRFCSSLPRLPQKGSIICAKRENTEQTRRRAPGYNARRR